jgi:hypothetical protein
MFVERRSAVLAKSVAVANLQPRVFECGSSWVRLSALAINWLHDRETESSFGQVDNSWSSKARTAAWF